MIATVRTARSLRGEVLLPGDKSISHRALMLGGIADGESRVRGLSAGADVASTAACMRALDVEIEDGVIAGRGMRGLRGASGPLDCGNSGTTMRLLAGLLSAQPFESELHGDESLSRRPMDRVVEPLRRMGAHAEWPPLRVGGGDGLHGIEYQAPVASAQVKSSLLLAGMYAETPTQVVELVATRDHTERMLRAMGADIQSGDRRVRIARTDHLTPIDIEVPRDVSASSFWLVAAGLIAGSRVRMPGVGLNPTRTGFVELLRRSGFTVMVSADPDAAGEPVGTIEVGAAADLGPMEIESTTAAAMIDELPVLAVAATQLPGTSTVRGARELRVKESDRISAMAEALTSMGADIVALEDGWTIRGPRHLEGATVDSRGDHRIAMALAVAALIADGETEIEGAESVDISYPGFWDQLDALRG